MKRLISSFLILTLAVLFAGCGNPAAKTEAQAETPAPVQSESPAETAEPATPEPTADTAEPVPETTTENTVLVVCFSATGITMGVAEKIAALTGAELVELIPAQLYTSEDLNYNDRTTRATVEQNTPDARPEIANEISLEGVKTLYLGYPIWWGQAPRIMSTFVESHDFTGIAVIPFCTSGGSGAGRTGETLGEQAGSGTFLSSTRFSAGVSDADLQAWIDKMN